jgi:putative peptidoglycan lipid II flippase
MTSQSLGYLVRKGSVITLITLVSRPLGYIREAVQAYLFGATLLVDAFVIAFNFPEMIQTLFFSGASSAFLIPVCSRYINDREEFSKIYSLFINISVIITVLVSLSFLFTSGYVMRIVAPGFGPSERQVATSLFVIMIPIITFHALLSVMKAFLNAREHFAAPEISGIVWNLVFIGAALLLYRSMGIYSLALGVSAGALIQVAVQIPYLRRAGIFYSPRVLQFRHPSVGEAKGLFLGALIATSIVPINSFVGRIIASYLPHGEVASLSYAFRIFILPFSLFAVPTYTVLFARISQLWHERDWEGMKAHIDSSLVLVAVTLIPSTIFLCLVGDIAVRILYERGAFTARDTFVTYKALFGYSIGLVFYALSISFVRIFNATHDMKTPAVVGLSSIVLNAVLAWLLMKPLANLGIAAATSLVSFYNFAVLYILFARRTGYRPSAGTRRELTRSLLAGIILSLSTFIIHRVFVGQAYLSLLLSLLAGLVIYSLFFKRYYWALLRRKTVSSNQ